MRNSTAGSSSSKKSCLPGVCCSSSSSVRTLYVTDLVHQIYYQLYEISTIIPGFIMGFVIDSHGDIITMMDKYSIVVPPNNNDGSKRTFSTVPIESNVTVLTVPKPVKRYIPFYRSIQAPSLPTISSSLIKLSPPYNPTITYWQPHEIQRFLMSITTLKMMINSQLSMSISLSHSTVYDKGGRKMYGTSMDLTAVSTPVSASLRDDERMDDILAPTNVSNLQVPMDASLSTTGLYLPPPPPPSSPSIILPERNIPYSSLSSVGIHSSSSHPLNSSIIHIKGNRTLTSIYEQNENGGGTVIVLVSEDINLSSSVDGSKNDELAIITQINLPYIENYVRSQLYSIHSKVDRIQQYVYTNYT